MTADDSSLSTKQQHSNHAIKMQNFSLRYVRQYVPHSLYNFYYKSTMSWPPPGFHTQAESRRRHNARSETGDAS